MLPGRRLDTAKFKLIRADRLARQEENILFGLSYFSSLPFFHAADRKVKIIVERGILIVSGIQRYTLPAGHTYRYMLYREGATAPAVRKETKNGKKASKRQHPRSA